MTKKTNAQWRAVIEGLEAIQSGEIPPTYQAKDGTLVNLGQDIRNWRNTKIPQEAPDDAREAIEQYLAASEKKPVKRKTPAQWRAITKDLKAFLDGKNNGKIPYTHTCEAEDGTLVHLGQDISNWRNYKIPQEAPDDAREVIEQCLAANSEKKPVKRKTPTQWRAITKDLKAFLDGKNNGKIPYTHTCEAEDGTLVHLGQDITKWRNSKIPQEAPDDAREVIEQCLAANSEKKPVKRKTSAQWRAVTKDLKAFLDGKNNGKIPHTHTCEAEDGTLVNLGQDIRNWKYKKKSRRRPRMTPGRQ